jgi:hypothetical protein
MTRAMADGLVRAGLCRPARAATQLPLPGDDHREWAPSAGYDRLEVVAGAW